MTSYDKGHELQQRSRVTTRFTSYEKGHKLVTCGFDDLTRGFDDLTRGFNHQTRASDDQTRATICHVLPHTHIE